MQKMTLCLGGASGTGKTELAIQVAKQMHWLPWFCHKGQIINADSVQMYKELNIGSNKPTIKERKRVPHYLFDMVSVQDDYNAAQFASQAKQAMNDIAQNGKIPIVVGGSGFYLQNLMYGTPPAPKTSDNIDTIRKELEQEADWDISIAKLRALDPERAAKINKNDYYRLARALDIVQQTGTPIQKWIPELQFPSRCIVLYVEKLVLYERLERRCEIMIEHGLIEETQQLLQAGLLRNESSAGKSIGYKQTIDLLQGKYATFLDYLTDFKKETRNLASTQYTWFRHQPIYAWIDVSQMIAAANQQDHDTYQQQLQKHVKHIIAMYNMSQAEYDAFLQSEEQHQVKNASKGRTNGSIGTYMQRLNQLWHYKQHPELLQSRQAQFDKL